MHTCREMIPCCLHSSFLIFAVGCLKMKTNDWRQLLNCFNLLIMPLVFQLRFKKLSVGCIYPEYSGIVKWASTCENLSSGVCKQQRRRPACTSAQSDQCLCYSLIGKNHTFVHKLACYKRNFNFLASRCSWAGFFSMTCLETLKTGLLSSRPK